MNTSRLLACIGSALVCAGATSAGPSQILTLRDSAGHTVTTAWHRPLPGTGDLAGVPVGIENGDFSSGLTGWTWEQLGGTSTPGDVTPVAEQAAFREGDSFLVSLHQTFVLTPNAAELCFDFFPVPGFDLTDAFIPDAFEASLLDAGLNSVVPTWHPLATSFWNSQEDGTQLLAPGVTVEGTRVRVDISHLAAGTTLRVQFDMIGGDADHLGGVAIDDVAITSDGCAVFPEVTLYGVGWPGTLGVPAVSANNDPVLGTTLSLTVQNSAGVPTTGVGFLSMQQAAIPTAFGGTLLLSPLPRDLLGAWWFPLPADSITLGHGIPDAPELCGVPVYGQAVLVDPGASHGYAFTHGIRFLLGG